VVSGERMNLSDWLGKWELSSLKINAKFLELEVKPDAADQDAAWELYIEMLTRIVIQPLSDNDGIEKTALDSIYSLFPTTREIIRRHGRKCQEFTKIAIVVLNQIVRPFTARWHRLAEQGAFDDPAQCELFRSELRQLQTSLSNYAGLLGDLAGVEQDFRLLEEE